MSSYKSATEYLNGVLAHALPEDLEACLKKYKTWQEYDEAMRVHGERCAAGFIMPPPPYPPPQKDVPFRRG